MHTALVNKVCGFRFVLNGTKVKCSNDKARPCAAAHKCFRRAVISAKYKHTITRGPQQGQVEEYQEYGIARSVAAELQQSCSVLQPSYSVVCWCRSVVEVQLFSGFDAVELVEVDWFNAYHIESRGGLLVRQLEHRLGDCFVTPTDLLDQPCTLNPVRAASGGRAVQPSGGTNNKIVLHHS